MDDHLEFNQQCQTEIDQQGKDTQLATTTKRWIAEAAQHNYSYHFQWLGRPIIQHPQDMLAVQQILWQVQPDLVIETGVARGGSLIYYASLLELIAQCGGPGQAKVLGIDIDIRAHNHTAITQHPMAKRIELLQGSSTDAATFAAVKQRASQCQRIVVLLDSNHTHAHVLRELELYAPLVTKGSYCVVFDTIIEDLPETFSANRPWHKGNNPKTAVWQYLNALAQTPVMDENGDAVNFTIDQAIEAQMLITVAPSGYLLRA